MTTENLIRGEFWMRVISDTFTYGLSESYLFCLPFHPPDQKSWSRNFVPTCVILCMSLS